MREDLETVMLCLLVKNLFQCGNLKIICSGVLTIPMLEMVKVPPVRSFNPSCPLDPFSWRLFSSLAISKMLFFWQFWKWRVLHYFLLSKVYTGVIVDNKYLNLLHRRIFSTSATYFNVLLYNISTSSACTISTCFHLLLTYYFIRSLNLLERSNCFRKI